MLTVHNRTDRTLRVPLPGHKFLHLGPQQRGEISNHAADFAPLRRLALAGELAIEPAGDLDRPATASVLGHCGRDAHLPARRAGVRGDR